MQLEVFKIVMLCPSSSQALHSRHFDAYVGEYASSEYSTHGAWAGPISAFIH